MQQDYLHFVNELDAFTTMLAADASLDNLIKAFDGLERKEGFERHTNRLRRSGGGTIGELFSLNLELLRGACADAYPDIHPNGVDAILAQLNAGLLTYREQPQPFLSWATSFVRAAALLQRFHDMQRDYQGVVRKAIWKIGKAMIDLGFSESEVPALENKVWEWLWFDETSPLYTDGVAKVGREHYANGSAGPSTRLYNFARFQALGWRTERLRQRARFMPLAAFLRAEDAKLIATVPQSLARPNLDKIERRPAEFEPDFDAALEATFAPDKPEQVTNAGKAVPLSPLRVCVGCGASLGRWNQSAEKVCFACWNSAFEIAA